MDLPTTLAVFPLHLAQADFDPAVVVVIVIAAIISLSFHEFAHAWTARLFGDDTAEREGRLTLNPMAHLDPVMTVAFPAITYILSGGGVFFGGARPVPVNPYKLGNPNRDNAVVALAGPLSNVLLALVFLTAYHAVYRSGEWEGQLLPRLLVQIASFNVLLVVFNLVPIPPLDGSRIVRWLLPNSLRDPYDQFERFGMFVILGLVFFFDPFQRALGNTIASLTEFLYRAVTLWGAW